MKTLIYTSARQHLSGSTNYCNRRWYLVFTLVTLIFLFGGAGRGFSQNRLSTPVKLTITDGNYDGVTVVLHNNTTGESQSVAGSARFELQLKYNCDYIVSFSKPGYITKKISLNTNAPESRTSNGFHPFPYEVVLFKQYDGVNIVIFNQPVGKISYSRLIDDFDYDTDYTKQIQSALKAAEEEIKQKQKEQAKLSAKQKKEEEKMRQAAAVEAKALAKKQAEEERQAAQQAKLEAEQAAKQKKEAEEEQRRNLAAQQGTDERPGLSASASAENRGAHAAVSGEDNKPSGSSVSARETRLAASSGVMGDDARPVNPGSGDSESPGVTVSTASDSESLKAIPLQGAGSEAPAYRMADGQEKQDDGFTKAVPVVVSEPMPAPETAAATASPESVRPDDKLEVLPDITVKEIKELNRVVTRVTIRKNEEETVYTRVSYNWGGTFYFREDLSISENLFFINTGMR